VTGYAAPARHTEPQFPTPEPTEGHPRLIRDRTDQERGEKMKLWETFNSEVPGRVFWPIMIVMLGILIPIVMSIR
jgi:hypothetical protein